MGLLLRTNIQRSDMPEKRSVLLLQILGVALFGGRAWQAWFYQLPLEEVLWDERLAAGPVRWLTGMDWEAYTASELSMHLEDRLCTAAGYWWALCAVACLLVARWPKAVRPVLWAGAASLLVLAVLYGKEDFWRPAQSAEYAMQLCLPVLIGMAATGGLSVRWIRLAAVATAVTFAAHGVYAVGLYPRPGHWIQWCLNVFSMSEYSAGTALFAAGILDFAAAAALVFFVVRPPSSPAQRWALRATLAYCTVWGLLTALARLAGPAEYIAVSGWESYWRQNLHETLVRLVHGGLPAIWWWAERHARPS